MSLGDACARRLCALQRARKSVDGCGCGGDHPPTARAHTLKPTLPQTTPKTTTTNSYEASQVSYKAGSPQGFALFSSALVAHQLVEMLSGLQVLLVC